jgi:hypothetical protein
MLVEWRIRVLTGSPVNGYSNGSRAGMLVGGSDDCLRAVIVESLVRSLIASVDRRLTQRVGSLRFRSSAAWGVWNELKKFEDFGKEH